MTFSILIQLDSGELKNVPLQSIVLIDTDPTLHGKARIWFRDPTVANAPVAPFTTADTFAVLNDKLITAGITIDTQS